MKIIMRNVSAGVVAIIAGVLVVVLGVINFGQRLHQPRYQVPGRAYLVTKTTPGSQPSKNYYVFGKNRDEGQLIVTPDKRTAKRAMKSSDNFKQEYKGQSQQHDQIVGTIWTYEAGHHNLLVESAPAGQPQNKAKNFGAKNLSFKHGKSIGHIKAYDQVGQQEEKITMKRVNFK